MIRAGFGISYTPFPDNTYAYNYPIRSNNEFDPAITTYGPAVLPKGSPPPFSPDSRHRSMNIPANGIIPVTAGLLENQTFFYINTDV